MGAPNDRPEPGALAPPTPGQLTTWARELGLAPLPWLASAEQLLHATAQLRGRPISLAAVPGLPATVCGMWLAAESHDIILVDAGLAGFRRDLVVMHEAAHVWFGHRGRWTGRPGSVPRRRFDPHQEWQAEWLATFLLSQMRGLHRSGWVGHESTLRAARLLAGTG